MKRSAYKTVCFALPDLNSHFSFISNEIPIHETSEIICKF